jgi:hypothetical protein
VLRNVEPDKVFRGPSEVIPATGQVMLEGTRDL